MPPDALVSSLELVGTLSSKRVIFCTSEHTIWKARWKINVVQRAQLGRKEVEGKRDERDEVRHQMKGVPFHHPSSSVNNLIWSSRMNSHAQIDSRTCCSASQKRLTFISSSSGAAQQPEIPGMKYNKGGRQDGERKKNPSFFIWMKCVCKSHISSLGHHQQEEIFVKFSVFFSHIEKL